MRDQDEGQRSNGRRALRDHRCTRWFGILAAGLLVVGAVACVYGDERPPDRRAQPTKETAAPPTRPAIEAREGTDYRRYQLGDTQPRFDPCRGPIRYTVHLDERIGGGLELIQEGIHRLSEATGLRFEFVGTTERTYTMKGWDDTSAVDDPVWIGWIDPDATDMLTVPGDDLGPVGGRTSWDGWVLLEDDTWEPTTGWIALKATTGRLPGYGAGFTRGNLVLHELGHLVGLDHVDDDREIMYRDGSGVAPDGYGFGDREGLRRQGVDGGCRPGPKPTATTRGTIPHPTSSTSRPSTTLAPTTTTKAPRPSTSIVPHRDGGSAPWTLVRADDGSWSGYFPTAALSRGSPYATIGPWRVVDHRGATSPTGGQLHFMVLVPSSGGGLPYASFERAVRSTFAPFGLDTDGYDNVPVDQRDHLWLTGRRPGGKASAAFGTYTSGKAYLTVLLDDGDATWTNWDPRTVTYSVEPALR